LLQHGKGGFPFGGVTIPDDRAKSARRGEDEIVDFANLSGLILPDEAQLRALIFLSAHKTALG